MPRVFVSYRRETSMDDASQLYSCLAQSDLQDVTFMEIDRISPGVNVREAIDRALDQCDILLALITPDWAGSMDKKGRRYLDNPYDYMRLEIALGLQKGIRVAPVLLHGALLPTPSELPTELEELTRRQAIHLRLDIYDHNIQQLVDSFHSAGPTPPSVYPSHLSRIRRWVWRRPRYERLKLWPETWDRLVKLRQKNHNSWRLFILEMLFWIIAPPLLISSNNPHYDSLLRILYICNLFVIIPVLSLAMAFFLPIRAISAALIFLFIQIVNLIINIFLYYY